MKKTIPWLAAALITLAACRKNLDRAPDSAPDGTAADVSFFKRDRPTPGTLARRTAAQPTFAHRGNAEYADEQEILLAPDPLPNPYTPRHMAAAHNLVYGTSLTEMPVTDLYVRFDPAADSQVAVLAEDLDLDLYEYPLDRELLQEGDYYVHPGKTAEDLQPLYTVVPAGFQFPAGIPHTVLSPLHLPPGGNVFLEELAESMAAGATYARSGGTGTDALLTRTDIPNGPGLRPPLCELTEDGPMGDCPNAGPPAPAPPVCGLPALQCGEAKRPRGRIRAWDTQKNQCLPLRGTQVVAKRWFKGVGTKIYTDAQGNWQSPQRFGGKVQVHTWFRNNTLSARPLRLNFGIRLSLLPVRHKQGSFQGCAMNTIDQIYYRHADRNTRSFLYWLAAHALNARAEQWDAAAQEGLKPFAGHRLVVYLQRGGEGYNRRAEPELLLQSYLYRKRGFGEWLFEAAKLAAYLAEENPAGAIVTYLNNILGGQRPDIVYRYNTLWENLSSSEVNQRFYAVYAQCGLLKAVEDGNGDVRWKRYFKAKAKDIDLGAGILGFAGKIVLKKIKAAKLERDGTYTSDNEQFNPTSLVTMVAGMLLQTYYSLSQPDREFYHQVLGFGEYFGHWLANERYGQLADPILNQKRERVTGDATGSSHKKYLEAWDPNEPLDEFKYSKEGLFHDLEDVGSEQIIGTQIFDFVSGIKTKDYQTAIMGGDVYASPEGWKEVMENVKFRFPLQTNNIVDLYRAYNVW